MAVLFKENYYVIAKVINFVVDSPARKMKAKNKRMHIPTALMFENNIHVFSMYTDVYGCPKLLDMLTLCYYCYVCNGITYVHRAEQREETSPSQQGDVPEDVPWEEKKADSGEKMEVEAESEDENYGMLVVRNRTAQLAPVDTENQEPVEQEEPAGDNLENAAMEGDDMEPQQIEQVQLRRPNRIRQPPERLGSVTYF